MNNEDRIISMLEQMQADIKDLKQGQAVLEREVSDIKQSQNILRVANEKLDRNHAVLEKELKSVKSDVAEIKTDVKEIKNDLKYVWEDLSISDDRVRTLEKIH